MCVYNACFSPTGGTERVMDLITEHIEIDTKIDLSKKEVSIHLMNQDDICYIGVPSFGGRVPTCVVAHLQAMKGDHTRAVLIVTYGNRAYDDTLRELKEVLSNRGFIVTAAVTAISEHSIMRQYGHGRPDEIDQKELCQYGDRIIEKLRQNSEDEIVVPGNYPYREYKGVPFKPKANKSCTSCGMCAKACPVGAIPFDKLNEVDQDLCISCMRCISVCPHDARVLNQIMVKAAAYKMKHVFEEYKHNEIFI